MEAESAQLVGFSMKSPFGVPEKPEFTVGLDEPLSKLKVQILNEGPSITVLTGLGGSGKTTLATKLCWDQQVKGKFRENIFFVTFSKTPKLKIIVERLFEQFGYQVPKFESDEDAVNELGILLRKFEGSPILLVLDDVWAGSEALVERFKFHLPNYKILVTSRVAFSRFGTPCILKPLLYEDALNLFCHYSPLDSNSFNTPHEDVVQKIVRNCKGLPLAIKVVGKSLSHRSYDLCLKMVEELSQGHSNEELLSHLQTILDIVEDNKIVKECFMDLGLFPEDQRIPVTTLIDMWAELYGLDDDGIEAMAIIDKLDSMNLVNVLIARKNASDTGNCYYNNHFIVLHDIIRELAIYQSAQEPIEERKRLIIDTNENNSEWGLGEKKEGIVTRVLASCFRYCANHKHQEVPALTLSISIDETCPSKWLHMQPTQAKVLILNLRTNQYSFPESLKKASKLKALIVTNYNFHPSDLTNFELLGCLSNLKIMRLERISVLSFVPLKSLKKLSLYMCNLNHVFQNGDILISDAFPNLVELCIDYCKDLVLLPSSLCDITTLMKLSITNCHKLLALPQEIGKLKNLELLRLSCCTDLEGIPTSIGKLLNLRHLDISNCISLSNLPEDFGKLSNLRNLYMTNCARCELPFSVVNLVNLKAVLCDEETAVSWEGVEAMLPCLQIDVPQVDVNLNWLHSVSS